MLRLNNVPSISLNLTSDQYSICIISALDMYQSPWLYLLYISVNLPTCTCSATIETGTVETGIVETGTEETGAIEKST